MGALTISSSVQAAVDALSTALERPILLDDPALAPLAYSRQWGVDAVRSESILSRGPSLAVRDALLGQEIASATDVVRTAPNAKLDMTERLCMPVRDGQRLLGYLWLLDPDDLPPQGLERVRAAAQQLAALISRPARTPDVDEAALIEALRSDAPTTREQAAVDAQRRGLLPDGPIALCLVAATTPSTEPVSAAQRVVRRLSLGHAIAGGAPEGAAILMTLTDPVTRTLHEHELSGWVRTSARADIVVGHATGQRLAGLHEASRQAAIALRVARARQADDPVASWSGLGADRIVAQLPPTALDDVPAALGRLLREDRALLDTLAAFLDAGGDVRLTAGALSLHRSGVYYRLGRIEHLTGLDLSSGDDRLTAHLAIRMTRLS